MPRKPWALIIMKSMFIVHSVINLLTVQDSTCLPGAEEAPVTLSVFTRTRLLLCQILELSEECHLYQVFDGEQEEWRRFILLNIDYAVKSPFSSEIT